MSVATGQTATLFRMALETGQTCPHGLKAKALLKAEGLVVDDRPLRTRQDVDRVKADLGVKTTPQILIGGEPVGGYDDLRRHFGKAIRDPNAKSYQPVIAVFCIAFLIAMALSWQVAGAPITGQTIPWFVATAMCLLGMQKLQDVDRFATMFLSYDLLAQRWPKYGYVYPFVETGAGVLMLAGVLMWLAVPAMLFIGAIGAVSVFRAVYVQKRELTCACVGGASRVPLGFVSLTENAAMVGMGLWGLGQML